MLTELIRFEWRYHTRQPAFYAAAGLFLLAGFGSRNLALTSSFVVTETLALVSLFSVFAIAIFVASAVLRDSEYRMEELVFSTPVSRFHYLFGRFGGAFAATVGTNRAIIRLSGPVRTPQLCEFFVPSCPSSVCSPPRSRRGSRGSCRSPTPPSWRRRAPTPASR